MRMFRLVEKVLLVVCTCLVGKYSQTSSKKNLDRLEICILIMPVLVEYVPTFSCKNETCPPV